MPRRIVIDEIHLTFTIPADLSRPACVALRRALRHRHFLTGLGRAVRQFLRRHPSLRPARLTVER